MLEEIVKEAEVYWVEGKKNLALRSILNAVAATSVRRYPKLKEDRKQFCQFIQDHSQAILVGGNLEINKVEIGFGDPDTGISLGEIFYQEMWCFIKHEAKLSEKVGLSDSEIVDGKYNGTLEIGMNRSLIRIPDFCIVNLIKIVKNAPENCDCKWL